MKINVTKNDIKNGLVGTPGLCPVALAVMRAAKASEVIVLPANVASKSEDSETVIVVYKPNKKTDVEMVIAYVSHNDDLADFLRVFDTGEEAVKPFKFTL